VRSEPGAYSEFTVHLPATAYTPATTTFAQTPVLQENTVR
jgi:hypothetical protein